MVFKVVEEHITFLIFLSCLAMSSSMRWRLVVLVLAVHLAGLADCLPCQERGSSGDPLLALAYRAGELHRPSRAALSRWALARHLVDYATAGMGLGVW